MMERLYVADSVKIISDKEKVQKLQKEANLPEFDYDMFKDLRGFVDGIHQQGVVTINYIIKEKHKRLHVHREAVELFLVVTLPEERKHQEKKFTNKTDFKNEINKSKSNSQRINRNFQMLKECLEKGDVAILREKCRNNPHIDDCEPLTKLTLFHLATIRGKLDELEVLRNEKARAEAVDIDGDTILHVAVHTKNIHIVEYICTNYPLLLKEKNNRNEVPFLIACKKENCTNIAIYLLEKDSTVVNEKDQQGYGAVHYVSDLENIELLEALLKYRRFDLGLLSNDGTTGFLIACKKGKKNIVIKMIEFCNKNDSCSIIFQRTSTNECGAQLAIRHGYISLAQYIIFNNPLEWSKLEINSIYGSILHTAVTKGCLNLVESIMLYDRKLIEIKDSNGCTPLDLALKLCQSEDRNTRLDALNIEKFLNQDIAKNKKRGIRLFSSRK